MSLLSLQLSPANQDLSRVFLVEDRENARLSLARITYHCGGGCSEKGNEGEDRDLPDEGGHGFEN